MYTLSPLLPPSLLLPFSLLFKRERGERMESKGN
jgi:hypothetical protein